MYSDSSNAASSSLIAAVVAIENNSSFNYDDGGAMDSYNPQAQSSTDAISPQQLEQALLLGLVLETALQNSQNDNGTGNGNSYNPYSSLETALEDALGGSGSSGNGGSGASGGSGSNGYGTGGYGNSGGMGSSGCGGYGMGGYGSSGNGYGSNGYGSSGGGYGSSSTGSGGNGYDNYNYNSTNTPNTVYYGNPNSDAFNTAGLSESNIEDLSTSYNAPANNGIAYQTSGLSSSNLDDLSGSYNAPANNGIAYQTAGLSNSNVDDLSGSYNAPANNGLAYDTSGLSPSNIYDLNSGNSQAGDPPASQYANGSGNGAAAIAVAIVGQNSNGMGANCGPGQNVGSFDFKSWGDPHITSSINGAASNQIDKQTDTPDLSTISNTYGGPTQLSTRETPVNSSGVAYNNDVDLGNGFWNLDTTQNSDGSLNVNLNDRNGSHGLSQGQSYTEADGATITNNGGNVTVAQGTRAGGKVNTTITNQSYGLDVEQQGTDAYVSGTAANVASS